MEYLFLIIIFVIFLAMNWFMENIAWIGILLIGALVVSIIVQAVNLKRDMDDGVPGAFDFATVFMFLLKIGAIALIAWNMM